MLIKKEKIEDLEFMEVEPEDEELRSIVMEEEDKAKKKAEEEYDFEVKRAEKKRLNEAMKRVEVSGGISLKSDFKPCFKSVAYEFGISFA